MKPTPPPSRSPSYSPTSSIYPSQSPYPTYYGGKAGKGLSSKGSKSSSDSSSSKGSKGYSSKSSKGCTVNSSKSSKGTWVCMHIICTLVLNSRFSSPRMKLCSHPAIAASLLNHIMASVWLIIKCLTQMK